MTEYPFPHEIIENFLFKEDIEELWAVLQEFKDSLPRWYQYDNVFEKKRAYDRIDGLPSVLRDWFRHMSGPDMLEVIEEATGIDGLIPDPYFRGAGIHSILPGGKLDIHKDFSIHPKLKLYRRVNLIIYMNKVWQDEWNGHLELWNKDMTKCEVKVAPLLNRAVIFKTDGPAFHGHPEELKCPEGITRDSFSFYYYTATPGLDKDDHSTMFKRRPQDDIDDMVEELRAKRNKGRL